MGKKYFILLAFSITIFTVNAQKFLSDENIIFYSDLVAPAAINAVDLDGDGDIDVIAALENIIFWYENIGGKEIFGPRQDIITLSEIIKCIYAADINGDGYNDILVAYDNKIICFKNTGEKGIFGQPQLIDSLSKEIDVIYAADLDGDDDIDIILAFRNSLVWYENTDGLGSFTMKQVITTSVDFAQSIYAADINGNGYLDILTASAFDDKIAWHENTDGLGTFSEQQVITISANYATSVFAADLTGNGYLDVLSASAADDKIAWYENLDGKGTFSSQKVIATSAKYPQYVYAADLDGDGDQDVFSASFFDDKVAWYKNTYGQGTFGPEQVISTTAEQAGFVWAGDLTGNGSLDVITASCDFKIAWHENSLPLKILKNPASSFVYPDSNVVLTIKANEHATALQWQLNTGSGFADLNNSDTYSGVNTDSLCIEGFHSGMSGYEYRCVVSGTESSLHSDKAVLIIAPGDQILVAGNNCQAVLPKYTANINYTQLPSPYTKISGRTRITLTCNDTSAIVSQVIFYVEIEDKTLPIFTNIPGDHTLEPNENGDVILPNYLNMVSVSDNCSGLYEMVITQSPKPFTKITDTLTIVTLSATDVAGNSSQTSFRVRLGGDFIPPVITSVHEDLILEADENCRAILPNYIKTVVATDNKDWPHELQITQSPAPWIYVTGDSNEVTLTVTDKAGNSTYVSFNVSVADNLKPVVTCLKNQVIQLEEGQTTYLVKGTELDPLSVYDNCKVASITNNINYSSSLSEAELPEGTTNIVWEVTDETGNADQCSFSVTVNQITGTETLNKDVVTVYPNPSKGLYSYNSGDHNVLNLRIIDLTGNVLIDKTDINNNEGTIDLSGFYDGFYFCRMKTDKMEFMIKLLKIN